jgi:hypothetical protein
MSIATPAGPGRSVAVRVIGLITLLVGVAYAVLGGDALVVGTAAERRLENDPAGGLGFLLQIVAGFVIVIGVAFLLQGLLGMLAGLGVLWYKPWGRVMTFILAVLAILWGLASLSFYDRGVIYIAFGGAQILYGILAFAILNKKAG